MYLKIVGWFLLILLLSGYVSQSIASTATAATATSLVAGMAYAVVKSDSGDTIENNYSIRPARYARN